MPSYNSARTIKRAITSVIEQSCHDWEMVICDDASDDGSEEIVREAGSREPRVRLIRSLSRSGPAAARNLALSQARGVYVAFLDADDTWEPGYLETMLESVGPGVGIVCCDALMVSPEGNAICRRSDVFGTAAELNLATLLRSNQIFVSTLCPRAVIEAADQFSADLFGTEDYDLWLKIVELGYSVRYVDLPLVRYRTASATSVSANRARMATNDRLVFERALARGRLGPRERQVAVARRDLAAAAEAWAAQRGISVRPLFSALKARARLALL